MSKRRQDAPPKRSADTSERSEGGPKRNAPTRPAKRAQETRRPTAPPRGGPSLLAQVAILVAVLVLVTLIAQLAGAANLGVALGIAQIAFAIALVALLLRS